MDKAIHRVLIVDDEPLIREATSRAMAAQEFCCETACDGRQAMQMYQEKRHDLVVTDLRMPKYHGHSLILELLKDNEPPGIVVLTGVANTRLVKDLLSRGVQDIVQKPIDFNVFATKMLTLIERGGWGSSFGQSQTNPTSGQSSPVSSQDRNGFGIIRPLHPACTRSRTLSPYRFACRPLGQLAAVLRTIVDEARSSARASQSITDSGLVFGDRDTSQQRLCPSRRRHQRHVQRSLRRRSQSHPYSFFC